MQAILKNAQKHRFKREVTTIDIAHYFPNTSEKYIRQFFEKKLGVKKEVADILVKLTTHKNHLPTGAPTSTLLSCFVHQEIFDSIYKKMQSQVGRDDWHGESFADNILYACNRDGSNIVRYKAGR